MILRLPNFLSVPGDIMAGFFLASGGFMEWNAALQAAVFAGIFFYAAGLLGNDYCDRQRDAVERPERPLPRGVMAPQTVLIGALLATILGLVFAFRAGWRAGVAAVVLTLFIWAYNLGIKHIRMAGPVLMGLCRSTSFVMGVFAIGWIPDYSMPQLWITAVGIMLYIAAVTIIAKRETGVNELGLARWMPGIVMTITLLALCLAYHHEHRYWPAQWLLFLGAMAIAWPWLVGFLTSGKVEPRSISKAIGHWIRGLILLQALLCMAAGQAGIYPGLMILLAFPIHSWLGRWISPS